MAWDSGTDPGHRGQLDRVDGLRGEVEPLPHRDEAGREPATLLEQSADV